MSMIAGDWNEPMFDERALLDEIADLKKTVAKYERRLEIDVTYVGKEMVETIVPENERSTRFDGIYCRDVEIKHLEQLLKEAYELISANKAAN